ncbi:MAG: SPASM domain-containing protein [Desulfuromonadaceae bacterium]|nr:SPASM domain-containing protein [Desulfuromonadaceae bacterium]
MSLKTFKAIIDKLPFIDSMELYRSGEAFLNPDLPEMIRIAKKRNIAVIISTNFSFSKPDHFFDDVVASGLDTLVVSLDGTSQSSYGRYRIGGDYNLVISNIKKLIASKDRIRSKTPKIIWQFLVNKYNEHEIVSARQIADSLNVTLDLRPISLADNEPDVPHESMDIEENKAQWLPINEAYISDCYKGEYRYPLSQGICTELFTRVVVQADGKILPCCYTWSDESSFGDLLSETFDDIWYNRKYLDARSRFLNMKVIPRERSICFKCNNFSTTPSMKDKFRLLIMVYRKALRHVVNTFL